MRLALTAGAAFVCGEMGHRRDPCSSHTLCRDQRAIWMHFDDRGTCTCTPHTHTHTHNEVQSRVNMLRE